MSISYRLIVSLFAIFFLNTIYSQNISYSNPEKNSPNVQNVIIVGTYHLGNKQMTGDSLYNLIKKISPDLLLTEALTINEKGPLKYKIGRLFGFARYNIEYLTEKKIKENGSLLQVLPYDMNLGNRLHYVEQRNKINRKAWKNINKFINSAEISAHQKDIFIKYISVDNFLGNYYKTKDLYGINRPNISDSVEMRMDILYNEILPIIKTNQKLIEAANFIESEKKIWDDRNNIMANNIISILNTHNNNKIIIVLCGHFHVYYLHKLLTPLQKENNFQLKELKE
jgi:hypothetical protein